ncbi:hypothetical protein KR093_004128, partial [Drosophila rubida]
SSGDCGYAAGQEFKLICRAYVTNELRIRWHDRRVTTNIEYSIWQAASDDSLILASFFESTIVQYSVVTVVPGRRFLKGKNKDGNFETIPFYHTDMHCFNYTLRYFVNLRSVCMMSRYDENAEPLRGVLHYADLYQSRGDSSKMWQPLNHLIIVLLLCLY